MTDRHDLETWADALLDQHRTAPKRERSGEVSLEELDPATRLMISAGIAKAPDRETLARTASAYDPDAWIGKAQAMGFVLAGLLLLSLLIAVAAG